jgi:hypothetical protein
MRARFLFGVALLLALGCGSGKKFAPVSGKVTLNGQPLAKALVSFQPIAAQGSVEAAVGSAATTNDKGEYTLKSSDGKIGAWVGKHTVRISAVSEQVGEGDERPPRGGWPQANKVPRRYNDDSKETFDVPSGGTDKANFDLKAP